MTAYLQKQRKVDLNVLADEAGMKGASSMRKDELVEALEKHIKANSSKLSSNSAFDQYFKGDPAATASESESKPAKPRVRRATKQASEFESENSPVAAAAAVVARTPRTVQRAAARIPLPPSPSAVTDLVERQATLASRRVQRYWDASGLNVYAEATRETLSSVVGLQVLLLAFEAYGLQRAVLPWRYAFTVPGLKVLNPLRVSAPDLFVLLTSAFWAPTTAWLLTSLVGPALVGWFFNLTIHAGSRRKTYSVDPLVFSLAKAIGSWLVYSQGWQVGGLISYSTALRVDATVPGGWFGIVIGSLVGVVASLYEASLRK